MRNIDPFSCERCERNATVNVNDVILCDHCAARQQESEGVVVECPTCSRPVGRYRKVSEGVVGKEMCPVLCRKCGVRYDESLASRCPAGCDNTAQSEGVVVEITEYESVGQDSIRLIQSAGLEEKDPFFCDWVCGAQRRRFRLTRIPDDE